MLRETESSYHEQLEVVTLERDNSERVRAMLETRLKRMEQQLVSEGGGIGIV